MGQHPEQKGDRLQQALFKALEPSVYRRGKGGRNTLTFIMLDTMVNDVSGRALAELKGVRYASSTVRA